MSMQKSIKDLLIDQITPKKAEVDTSFLKKGELSAELKATFTKVALDMGCEFPEIYSMIKDLEHGK
jgi:hypothetical protein